MKGGDVKERPILFSGPMVKAILAGQKTMTRRVVKPTVALVTCDDRVAVTDAPCPYGEPGDRLWVRETWAVGDRDNDVLYASDQSWCVNGVAVPPPVNKGTVHAGNWRPSIHMPRWASRITLEVVAVRVEPLRDITEADALAEGIPFYRVWRGKNEDGDVSLFSSHADVFAHVWDSVNFNRYPWASNPWVWCVTFSRVTP